MNCLSIDLQMSTKNFISIKNYLLIGLLSSITQASKTLYINFKFIRRGILFCLNDALRLSIAPYNIGCYSLRFSFSKTCILDYTWVCVSACVKLRSKVSKIIRNSNGAILRGSSEFLFNKSKIAPHQYGYLVGAKIYILTTTSTHKQTHMSNYIKWRRIKENLSFLFWKLCYTKLLMLLSWLLPNEISSYGIHIHSTDNLKVGISKSFIIICIINF